MEFLMNTMGLFQRHPSHNPAYESLKQVLIQIFRDYIPTKIFENTWDLLSSAEALATEVTCFVSKELKSDIQCEQVDESMVSEVFGDKKEEIFTLIKQLLGNASEETQYGRQQKTFISSWILLVNKYEYLTEWEVRYMDEVCPQQERLHNMSDVTVSASKCLMNKMAGYILNDLRVRFKGGFTCKLVDYPLYVRLQPVLIQLFRDKYEIPGVKSRMLHDDSDLVDNAEVLATQVTRYMIKELESDIQCEEVDESLASIMFGDKKEEIFKLIKQYLGETNEETQDGQQQETSHNMSDVTVSASKCLMKKMADYIQNLKVMVKDGFTCKVVDYPLYKRLKHALIKLFRDKYKIPAIESLSWLERSQYIFFLVDNAESLAKEVACYMIKKLEFDILCEQVDESLASKVFGDKKEELFTLIKQFFGETNEETQDGQQQATSHAMSDVTVSASSCFINKMADYIQNLKVRFKDGFTCKVVDFPLYVPLKHVLIQFFCDKYNMPPFKIWIYDMLRQESDLVDNAEGLATKVTHYIIEELDSGIQCEQANIILASKVFGNKKEELFTLLKNFVGKTNEETQDGQQQATSHAMSDVTVSVSKCLMNKMAGYIQNDLRVRFKGGYTCKVMDYPLYERLECVLIQLLCDKYKIPALCDKYKIPACHMDFNLVCLDRSQYYSDIVDDAEYLATLVTRFLMKESESDIQCEHVNKRLASKVFGDKKEEIFTLIKQLFGETNEETQDGRQQETQHDMNDVTVSASSCFINKMAGYIQNNLRFTFKGGFTCKVVDFPHFERLKRALIQLLKNKRKSEYFVLCLDRSQKYSVDHAEDLASMVTCYMFNELQRGIQYEQVDGRLASKVFGQEKKKIFRLVKKIVEMKLSCQSTTLFNDVTEFVTQILMNKTAGYIQNDLALKLRNGFECKLVDYLTSSEFVKMFDEIMLAKECYRRQIAISTFCAFKDVNLSTDKQAFRILKQSTSSMCAFLCPPHVYLRGADDSDRLLKASTRVEIRT